jgi:Mg-chelatase subunit ChlD
MLARGIGGGTAIGSGLFAGIQAVTGTNSRPFAVPTIVLLTDGNQNSGPSPLVAAAAAQSAGIVVHTITFGDSADRALMQQVASQTGGTFLHASDEAALQSAFRELARTLPVLLTQ